LLEGSRLIPCQPVFQIPPEALDGIEFGRVGREEQQAQIGWQPQGAGFVKRAIIEQEEMEADRIGGGQVVEEELKAVRIEGGQFQKETLPGEGFYRAVEVETLEAIGGRHHRLNSARGKAATHNRQEPTATFVLYPQAPLLIAVLVSVRYARVELRAERRLKLARILGLFFGCERRGALSFAFNL
jgi:hypothetical protein